MELRNSSIVVWYSRFVTWDRQEPNRNWNLLMPLEPQARALAADAGRDDLVLVDTETLPLRERERPDMFRSMAPFLDKAGHSGRLPVAGAFECRGRENQRIPPVHVTEPAG